MAPLPDAAAMPAPAKADDVVRLTRAVAVASVAALVALGLAWELWLAPTGSRTWAVKVLPLLIPLPGLLRLRLYTYRWTSLLVWLYFTEGVVRATSDGGTSAALAALQVLLSIALFAACAAHVRWRLRAAARRAPEPAP